MLRFHVVHNIPSPYRLHLFERLDAEIRDRGGEFCVHFMAANHRERPASWARTPDQLPFAATLSRDVGPFIRNYQWHLNPTLLMRLAKARPTVVMVGGPWDSPTTLLSSILPIGTTRVAWYEPNAQVPGRVTGAAAVVKRTLLSRYDIVAVPGSNGEVFTKELLHVATPTVCLPNLVDERRFAHVDATAIAKARTTLDLGGDDRLAFWPARLDPVKGIVEFMRQLDPQLLRGWQIRIVGEGPIEADVRAAIAERKLEGHVRIIPFVAYADMPALYAAADLFLLPSLQDQNPLTVVEAIHAGLPLLLSTRAGNAPEAVADGDNGFAMDARDPAALRDAAVRAFGSSREILRAMGERSRERASFWDSGKAVKRFVDAVLAVKN